MTTLQPRALLRRRPLRPSKTAMVIVGRDLDEERWSYAEVDRTVRRLAGGLLGLGLEPGARIMIRMGNEADFALMYFAAIAAASSRSLRRSSRQREEVGSGGDRRRGGPGEALAGRGGTAARRRPCSAPTRSMPPPEGGAPGRGLCRHPRRGSGPSRLHLRHLGPAEGRVHAQRIALGRRPMHDHWMGLRRRATCCCSAGPSTGPTHSASGSSTPGREGPAPSSTTGPRDPGIWPALIARHRATIFAATPGVYRQLLEQADLATTTCGACGTASRPARRSTPVAAAAARARPASRSTRRSG